jgi:hypothetical protein
MNPDGSNVNVSPLLVMMSRVFGLRTFSTAIGSLVNDFAKTENGLITFASSQGSELSQESPAGATARFRSR